MREIKFRVYDKREKGMRFSTDENCCSWDGHSYDNPPIMQFTGLLDKNGKEIYEGDILSDGKYIAEIAWGVGKAGFLFTGGRHSMEMATGIFQLQATQCEVIGNIYENPDLLTLNNPNSL